MTVHTPTTHTRCTNHATKIETIKNDDLYTTAGECEYKKPISDNNHKKAATPNSSENTVRYELAADETSIFSGNIRQSFQENSPWQIDRVTEQLRINIWSPLRIRVRSILTLRLPNPAVQSIIYVIIQNRIAMTTTDFKILIRACMIYRPHTYTLRKS